MLFDDGIKWCVLRLVALVAVAWADDPVAGNSFHQAMMAIEAGLFQRSIARRCVRNLSQSPLYVPESAAATGVKARQVA